jgi:hypothetical protein
MPGLGARTQGLGNYCRMVRRLILYTWNDESPLIVELSVGFSFPNACACAKNGIFGHICRVLSIE